MSWIHCSFSKTTLAFTSLPSSRCYDEIRTLAVERMEWLEVGDTPFAYPEGFNGIEKTALMGSTV